MDGVRMDPGFSSTLLSMLVFIYYRTMDDNEGNSGRLVFSQSQPISLEGSPQSSQMVSRGGIFKLLRSPGIETEESIPPCCLAGRYDSPIPSRFLVPIDCYTIPAQEH